LRHGLLLSRHEEKAEAATADPGQRHAGWPAHPSRCRPFLQAFAALEAEDWKARVCIAQLLPERVHFAAFSPA